MAWMVITYALTPIFPITVLLADTEPRCRRQSNALPNKHRQRPAYESRQVPSAIGAATAAVVGGILLIKPQEREDEIKLA